MNTQKNLIWIIWQFGVFKIPLNVLSRFLRLFMCRVPLLILLWRYNHHFIQPQQKTSPRLKVTTLKTHIKNRTTPCLKKYIYISHYSDLEAPIGAIENLRVISPYPRQKNRANHHSNYNQNQT